MAVTNTAAISKSVKSGEPASLYYFYGHDTAALESFVKKLVTVLCPPDAQIMNLHQFRQSDTVLDIPAIVDACEALPMFAERSVVTINDLNMDKLPKADGDDLRKILADLPPETTVIIYSTGVDLFKNKKSLTDKNRRFCDYCAKHGEVCEFGYKSASESGRLIASALSKSGCAISRQNAERIAELCLCDSAYINNEIQKLSAYCKGREVTAEDIDALCVKRIESDGYTLAVNILKDDAKFVFSRLRELAQQNYEAFEIVSIIGFSLTDIYRAKLARSSGRSYQDAAQDFKYPKNREFAIKNAYSTCGNFSLEQIRETLDIMTEVDLTLKTRSMDKKGAMLTLEQGIAKCLMLSGKGR